MLKVKKKFLEKFWKKGCVVFFILDIFINKMKMNIRDKIRVELRRVLTEGDQDMIIMFKLYSVIFNTTDSSNYEYYGPDINKAEDIFNSPPDIPENMLTRSDMSFVLMECVNKYRFLLDDLIEDFPIEDYYDDSTVYELVHEGDWVDVKYREIGNINIGSDELLNNVERYYRGKYGKYKYNTIEVYDDSDEYKGCIQLRISDHTENIHNIDRFGRCDYYISVVIANYDPTKNRFGMSNDFERRSNERELIFNGDDDFDEVILDINILIDEFSEDLIYK